jgi:hypothetical protein
VRVRVPPGARGKRLMGMTGASGCRSFPHRPHSTTAECIGFVPRGFPFDPG